MKVLDSSLSFLREGYTFISSRCDRLGVDLFRTRIAGRPVICMRGAEAAEIFYDGGRFTRSGALPPTTVHLLQDRGSVQTLDDGAHHRRKAMFMSVMSGSSISGLVNQFEDAWRRNEAQWHSADRIILHREVRKVLTEAVCGWAGVSLAATEVNERASEFGLMIDNAGHFGPANWHAQFKRRSTERWAARAIEEIRSGRHDAPAGCPAVVIANYKDDDGTQLPVDVAAIELLNLLRPVVAVARYIVFAAVALEKHSHWKGRFASGDDADLEPFAQEVRRFYPYFPVIGGSARTHFSWHGQQFSPGDWVLLDLYGTNHDRRNWQDPETFSPERFRGWDDNPYTLVPQGAGIVDESHRCPGERITVELIKSAAKLLSGTDLVAPAQDLSINLARMPALPKSGFVLQAP